MKRLKLYVCAIILFTCVPVQATSSETPAVEEYDYSIDQAILNAEIDMVLEEEGLSGDFGPSEIEIDYDQVSEAAAN